jgi:hypothetical protein
MDRCAQKYISPAAGVSLTVGMSNELGTDYRLWAVCLLFDGAGVMYAHEPGERRIIVAPGAHKVTAFAKWASTAYPNYKFEVATSHEITVQTSSTVHVTFFELGSGPLQDRPKGRWTENQSAAPAPAQDAASQ